MAFNWLKKHFSKSDAPAQPAAAEPATLETPAEPTAATTPPQADAATAAETVTAEPVAEEKEEKIELAKRKEKKKKELENFFSYDNSSDFKGFENNNIIGFCICSS